MLVRRAENKMGGGGRGGVAWVQRQRRAPKANATAMSIRAELRAQDHSKKMRLFGQLLSAQSPLANGVLVQRIMANDLRRLLDPNSDDPLAEYLADVDSIFEDCNNDLGDGAVASALEAIVEEAREDKREGENGEGCVLLAWKMDDPTGAGDMELVGIATLFRMKATPSFSTHREMFAKQAEYNRLVPFFEGRNNGAAFPAGLGIKAKYMYLDVLCSKQRGVGTLLILHAYRYAILRKTKGLVALSFSKRPIANRPPQSYKIFEKLGFETVVRNTDYTVRMYGHWVAKSTQLIDFEGILEQIGQICTRPGYTDATSHKRIFRCGG